MPSVWLHGDNLNKRSNDRQNLCHHFVTTLSPWCHRKCLKSPSFAYGCLNQRKGKVELLLGKTRGNKMVAGVGFEPTTSGL